MKDLFPGNAVRDEFQRWLDVGHGPFTIFPGGKDMVTFSCLEKMPSVNYLYRISSTQDAGISWESSLLFCGVYDTEHRALYLTKDSLDIFTSGNFPLVSEVGPSMAETISGRIDRRVEDTIANDRNNLPVGEVTGWRAKQDIQYYRERGAREEAIERFFSGKIPDGLFRSGYAMDTLPETAFLAWRQDPEGFIQTEAEMHIKTNREKFLLQFLKNDALMEEYQVLAQDTVSAIHRMKGITDALKGCGAKTVTVTVEKDGEELTFKTGTSYLYGYRSSYSTSGMAAPDRREFERLFGRYAQYTAEDVTKITYGKKTVYEAPSSHEESMAESAGPVMGGM
jgi:hypothetical protein